MLSAGAISSFVSVSSKTRDVTGSQFQNTPIKGVLADFTIRSYRNRSDYVKRDDRGSAEVTC